MAAPNAYEQKRLQRIAANQRRMDSLGIDAAVPSELRARSAAQPRPRHRKRAAAPPDPADCRRSSRLKELPAVVHATFEENEDLGDHWRRRGTAAAPRDDGEPAPPPPPGSVAASAPAAPGSSKGLPAHVAELQACLAQQLVPPDGAYKAHAMQRLGGLGRPPRFNKYSGIQEWTNAVALFVNVRGKTGEAYRNLFMDGGRRMTFFAQPSQTPETPVITRLLACSDAACESPTVLFLREEGGPYTYAGRLRCSQFYPSSRPLKIEWELLDYEALAQVPSAKALLE